MVNLHTLKFALAAIFIGSALFLGTNGCCKKEEVKPLVTPDSGSIVFWQNSATRTKYKNMGVAYYYFYVAGKKVGELYTDNYWNIAPDCGADIAVTAKIDMTGIAEKNVQIQVRTNTLGILMDINATFKANQCINFEVK